ncbi:hypothetical protein P8452_24185 [Trifolium repens]|nr:hypothetical protein P8452_24185 [Trifolium repens]
MLGANVEPSSKVCTTTLTKSSCEEHRSSCDYPPSSIIGFISLKFCCMASQYIQKYNQPCIIISTTL